jgi:hypothetical protein
MPRKDPTAVSPKQFFGKYANEILENDAREKRLAEGMNASRYAPGSEHRDDLTPPRLITTSELGEEVKQWWPVGLLRKAARENQSEDYKRILAYFLGMLEVPPPDGVLVPFRWKLGRPEETEMIYREWLAHGQPSLQWRALDHLAKTFYPEQFTQAKSNGKLRKNLRDRIRNTILRYKSQAAKRKSQMQN